MFKGQLILIIFKKIYHLLIIYETKFFHLNEVRQKKSIKNTSNTSIS